MIKKIIHISLLFTYLSHLALASDVLAQAPKTSFHKMLLKKTTKIKTFFGKTTECMDDLRDFYDGGNLLKSVYIDKNTIFLNQYSFPEDSNHGEVFYHYTNAEPVKNIALKNNILDIFKYVRRYGLASRDPYLYIAADPISSKHYGKYQVRLYFKEDTKVLIERKWNNSSVKIKSDLSNNYPELASCKFPADQDLLFHLALEDNNVDVIKYMSIKDGYWFQLFNPYSVKSIELGNKIEIDKH